MRVWTMAEPRVGSRRREAPVCASRALNICLYFTPLRIQRQDYGKAVACYKAAIGILRNHAHVPSFKSIQRESDQIISSLKGAHTHPIVASPSRHANLL